MVRVRQIPGRLHARREMGAVAVEFALLFPLLFFLLFGTLILGWRVWEHQAAQSTAADAARLAALGIPNLNSYQNGVLCIGEHSGLQHGSLERLQITFYPDVTMTSPEPALLGGYVQVSLTYRSALGAFPMITTGNGAFTSTGTSRIEQLGPTDVNTGQILTLGGASCR
jgi:hypothetical protein